MVTENLHLGILCSYDEQMGGITQMLLALTPMRGDGVIRRVNDASSAHRLATVMVDKKAVGWV